MVGKKYDSYVQEYQSSVCHVHFAAFTEAQQNDKRHFWLWKEKLNTLLQKKVLIFPKE